jgi:hypothetical protein
MALAVAGCGSSSHPNGTEADPASAVPASAPLYLGATVRPDESLRGAALAAGSELTGQPDPYEKLLGTLRTPGSSTPTSAAVDAWLGPHAGLFLDSLSGAEPLFSLVEKVLSGKSQPTAPPFSKGHLEGAIVMDTSDSSKARSFLSEQAKRAGAHAGSYRGVSYEVTSAGLALGLVGRFAVIGSEEGLRQVIGATQGEPALASAGGYRKLAAQAPSGALAHLYVNPTAAAAGGASSLLGALGGEREANLSLIPAKGSVTLDVDTLATPGAAAGLLAAEPQAAQALGELPGESWLAVGLGPLQQRIGADVAGLRGLGSLLSGGESTPGTTLSLGALLSGLITPLAVMGSPSPAAKAAFASWMGPAGIFAAGSSVLELKAGVVIDSTDAARSKAAVGALAAALRKAGDSVAPTRIPGTEAAVQASVPGLPLALEIAAGRNGAGQPRFVLGLGEEGVRAALAPSSTLSSAAATSAATSALGEGITPSLEFDAPTLLSLLEGIGLLESPGLSEFVPYLRALGTISGGGRTLGGEVERFKLVLSLHHGQG